MLYQFIIWKPFMSILCSTNVKNMSKFLILGTKTKTESFVGMKTLSFIFKGLKSKFIILI